MIQALCLFPLSVIVIKTLPFILAELAAKYPK